MKLMGVLSYSSAICLIMNQTMCLILLYNILAGGHCLEDIELLRNDEAWLDALDAEIIPDPTTAGDFLRRFDKDDITELMEIKNTIRKRIWQQQPKNFS